MAKVWAKYMVRDTAARYCGVPEAQFIEAIASGEIAPIESSTAARTLFSRDDLDAWIASQAEKRSVTSA